MIFILIAALLSGVIGGMGIGGGALLIPALTLFYGLGQKEAQVINLIYFIPTAAAALIGHIKNKRVERAILKPMTGFGLAGCTLGAVCALLLTGAVLRRLFGVFLIIMGIREIMIRDRG